MDYGTVEKVKNSDLDWESKQESPFIHTEILFEDYEKHYNEYKKNHPFKTQERQVTKKEQMGNFYILLLEFNQKMEFTKENKEKGLIYPHQKV